MVKVGNVPARLVNEPPLTYSFTPALQGGTTYHWKVVALTNASHLMPSAVAHSSRWTFTTAPGTAGPPAAPSNPAPSNGATGVGTSVQLSWAPGGAGTTYNVAFGTSNPPPQVATGLTNASYTPATLSQSTTYFWRVTAISGGGTTSGPVWSFTTGTSATAAEVVLYASDATTRVGGWTQVPDATAAGGQLLRHADAGYANMSSALANPLHYFEATFQAEANTRYRVWVRMRAQDDSNANDSVYVQFSDSINSAGSAIYRIGTTSGLVDNLWTSYTAASAGWGWSRHAFWLSDTGEVRFQNSGTHTIRIQTREDGVDIDQIVISPATYLNAAPGPVRNDDTIVAKPGGGDPPPPTAPSAPASPSPANGATGVSVTPTLTWSAAGATSYNVAFGTANPPPVVSNGQSQATFSPAAALANSTTYFWRITAVNGVGSTIGPLWSFTTAAATSTPPPDVVIYAGDIPSTSVFGGWTFGSDPASPNQVRLETADNGFQVMNAPLANPTHYVDVTFTAAAGVPYRIWLRLRALNNNNANDAVWVQFSDALSNGNPAYRTGTTSGLLVNLATGAGSTSLNGWGWNNGAYFVSQATSVTFASDGTHTMRIQVREDGIMLDQIVLSPSTYFSKPPGPSSNDSTIVPKPQG
jgi:hypothetical protein